MKKVYVTITGIKYYYGFNPFSIGKKLTCKKEHNNPYDSEAIKVTMKNIGTGVHRTPVGNNTNYGFNFERIACNRVHCTRTGEQLQYYARV